MSSLVEVDGVKPVLVPVPHAAAMETIKMSGWPCRGGLSSTVSIVVGELLIPSVEQRPERATERPGSILQQHVECAPGGGQNERLGLTALAGLPENGSRDEASITQRRVQAASC